MNDKACESQGESVVDLRPYGEQLARNPYPVYARLKEEGPVHRVILPDDRLPDGREVWLVLGYHEAKLALSSPAFVKDWRAAPPEWRERQVGDPGATAPLFGRHMLVVDPPDHTRLRKPAAKAFTPTRVEALRPRVQEIANNLLDAMPDDGRADLVDAFAFPLSMGVICEALGVPLVDQQRFRSYSHEIVSPTGKEKQLAAKHALIDYLHDLIDRKRAQPGEDLMSALIEASDEGDDKLSASELCGTIFVLLVAGHETTVNLITNDVFALLQHPDQLAALRADLSLIENTVEEILRYDGPLETTTRRFAAEPVEIGGRLIPGDGSEVLVCLASANHDSAHFEEPHSFDIRRGAAGHLAFGHGIHFCLGAGLGRMECQVALRSLLERFSDLGLDVPSPAVLTWHPGFFIRGLKKLPIRYGFSAKPKERIHDPTARCGAAAVATRGDTDGR